MSRIGAAGPINAHALVDAAKASQSGESKAADESAKITKVAREFESIFVRQILETSKVAGDGKGYGSLGVNALADAMVEGGGFGMAASLEHALRQRMASVASAPKEGASGAVRAAAPDVPHAAALTGATAMAMPEPASISPIRTKR